MPPATAQEVREVILERVGEPLAAKGLTPAEVPASFDLLLEGVIDSFGVVEMIVMLEQRFAVEFDLDELPDDDLTKVGALSEYVERKGRRS
jgi:acyl carrier protein